MSNNKKQGKHSWLMMLCCLLPIIVLMTYGPQLKDVGGMNLSWLVILICPIMHIGMMFFMKDKGDSCHGNHSDTKKVKEKNATSVE